jgi:hypothetical protein
VGTVTTNLLDKHSKKIDTESDKITRAAIKIYVELMIEKRRRLKGSVES